MSLPKLVLFDLDGVLADDRHRYPYYARKQFAEYFSRISEDAVLPEGLSLFNYWRSQEGRAIELGFLTSREGERNGRATVTWLCQWGFMPWGWSRALYMRQVGDTRRPPKVKLDVLTRLAPHYSEIHFYDDSRANIRAAQTVIGSGAHLVTWCKYPRMNHLKKVSK